MRRYRCRRSAAARSTCPPACRAVVCGSAMFLLVVMSRTKKKGKHDASVGVPCGSAAPRSFGHWDQSCRWWRIGWTVSASPFSISLGNKGQQSFWMSRGSTDVFLREYSTKKQSLGYRLKERKMMVKVQNFEVREARLKITACRDRNVVI